MTGAVRNSLSTGYDLAKTCTADPDGLEHGLPKGKAVLASLVDNFSDCLRITTDDRVVRSL